MGKEPLDGLCVFQKPEASIQQENQQTDHFPSRYKLLAYSTPKMQTPTHKTILNCGCSLPPPPPPPPPYGHVVV